MKQTDWKDSTKAVMEAYGDNPKDFPYQEPKQERSYSEEEVYNILEQAMKDAPIEGLTHHYDGDFRDLKEWFEQIKKK
jgi:hypothetical protein